MFLKTKTKLSVSHTLIVVASLAMLMTISSFYLFNYVLKIKKHKSRLLI
jgi:hypothetical protein